MIVDTVVLSLALSLAAWITVVRPLIVGLPLSSAGRQTVIAIWVAHVAVLVPTARAMLIWRKTAALALLGVGVVGLLVSDYLYAVAVVTDLWRPAESVALEPISIGHLVSIGMCGAAGLTPSMTRIASVPHACHQVGPGRMAMLSIGLLVGPTALLAQTTSGAVTSGVAIAVVSATIGILVLIRLWLCARDYRSRVRRERALRDVSGALVAATTEDDVVVSLDTAFASMLPAGARPRVRLIDRADADTSAGPTLSPLREAPAPAAHGGGPLGELKIPIHVETKARGERAPAAKPPQIVFTAMMTHLVELGPVLQALAEQAGSALDRIGIVARLRAAEREHYFRTLVLTSTDVTLISRGGRIEYATPSAQALFGRDVTGAPFDRLVSRQPSGQCGPYERWADVVEGVEGYVHTPDGRALTVLVDRRDLTTDATVNGVVTTLRDVTAEREAQRSLAFRASHDALTGLANAASFRDEVRAEAKTASTNSNLSAALFIDLDNFKTVNDTYGHEIGDELLTRAANRIHSSLRSSDVAARLGGDEFAVLLRHLSDPETARNVTQRISDELAVPATVSGVSLNCQASIGLALARNNGEYDSLLRRADAALYAAKAEGKGHWRQYQDAMLKYSVPCRTDHRAALERLMRDDGLVVHYQPIVELATGCTVGFEALVRSTQRHDDGAIAPPTEEVIGIADNSGLTTQLEDWVLAQALTGASRLHHSASVDQPYVSVNVSVRQIRQPDFVERILDLLATVSVGASQLVVEITENLLVDEDKRAWSHLAKLRSLGIRVAIDDFGTGRASICYLCRPAFDIVKIDRMFVQNIHTTHTQTLLKAIIDMVVNLGLDAIVDGVEDTQTLETLLALGCRYGQGFLYGGAMPLDKLSSSPMG